jgi:MoaA/NifB/PqqE/SkfB family radical SAM enzyme
MSSSKILVNAIGIKDNSTGFAILYVPEFHLFLKSEIRQNKPVEFYTNYSMPVLCTHQNEIYEEYNKLETQAVNKIPNIGYVIVNNVCNMNCTFCYAAANTNHKRVDISDLEHLSKILPKNSFRKVIISGGEPLLDFDLVKQIRTFFDEMTINSNGMLLTEDIANWLVETKTKMYIALDYEIKDFEGHDFNAKAHVESIIAKVPEVLPFIEVAVTYPSDKLDELKDIRTQNLPFEKELTHDFNYIKGKDPLVLTKSIFEKEIERIERDEISLQESIFHKPLKYIRNTYNWRLNIESCSPAVHLNHLGDLHLCQVRASNTNRPEEYEKDVICKAKDFNLDIYRQRSNKDKKIGVCTIDKNCNCRWFCGNICWANIKHNKHNCEVLKYSLFYSMYLVHNYLSMEGFSLLNLDRFFNSKLKGLNYV